MNDIDEISKLTDIDVDEMFKGRFQKNKHGVEGVYLRTHQGSNFIPKCCLGCMHRNEEWITVYTSGALCCNRHCGTFRIPVKIGTCVDKNARPIVRDKMEKFRIRKKREINIKSRIFRNKYNTEGVYTTVSCGKRFIPKVCLGCRFQPDLMIRVPKEERYLCKASMKMPTRKGVCKMKFKRREARRMKKSLKRLVRKELGKKLKLLG